MTTPATCGAEGVETGTCSCGATTTRTIPATGAHTWDAWQDAGDGAHHAHTCTVCGQAETAAHAWGGWTPDTASLSHTRTCADCGAAETEAHAWSDGSCADCGASVALGAANLVYANEPGNINVGVGIQGPVALTLQNVPRSGLKVTVEATLNNDGINSNGNNPRCGFNGDTAVVVSIGTTHTADAAGIHGSGSFTLTIMDTAGATILRETYRFTVTTTDGVTSVSTVQVCDSHTWSSWETVTAATCTMEGLRKHTCTVCGQEESEPIARLDHSWGPWRADGGEHVRTCTACGTEECAPHTEGGSTCPECGVSLPYTISADTNVIHITDVGGGGYAIGADTDLYAVGGAAGVSAAGPAAAPDRADAPPAALPEARGLRRRRGRP